MLFQLVGRNRFRRHGHSLTGGQLISAMPGDWQCMLFQPVGRNRLRRHVHSLTGGQLISAMPGDWLGNTFFLRYQPRNGRGVGYDRRVARRHQFPHRYMLRTSAHFRRQFTRAQALRGRGAQQNRITIAPPLHPLYTLAGVRHATAKQPPTSNLFFHPLVADFQIVPA